MTSSAARNICFYLELCGDTFGGQAYEHCLLLDSIVYLKAGLEFSFRSRNPTVTLHWQRRNVLVAPRA